MDGLDDIRRELGNAVRSGKVSEVVDILHKYPVLLKHGAPTETWLHKAARHPSVEMIEALVRLGLDVNGGGENTSPLGSALAHNQVDAARKLLELGAKPNRGRIIISAVSGPEKRSLEFIKLLDEYGADIHKEFIHEGTNEPMNALSAAIFWGKTDAEKYLRSKGARLPEKKPKGANLVATTDNEIVTYFRENFGEVQKLAIVEVVRGEPAIAVNIIMSTPGRPFVTLFTTGMSSIPMNVPVEHTRLQFAEVFIQLPANWKPTQLDDPQFAWPVHWLRVFAQTPHAKGTFLPPVSIIPNGVPPKPLADNVRFDSILSMAEKDFRRRDGQTVYLHRLTPLYPEERKLVERKDIGALLRAFDQADVSLVTALDRKNVGL